MTVNDDHLDRKRQRRNESGEKRDGKIKVERENIVFVETREKEDARLIQSRY